MITPRFDTIRPRGLSRNEPSRIELRIPDFYEKALCPQVDNDGFFPDRGASPRAAKQVCLSCPVRAECLEYALENDERWGVWGGTSEAERRKMRKVRKSS